MRRERVESGKQYVRKPQKENKDQVGVRVDQNAESQKPRRRGFQERTNERLGVKGTFGGRRERALSLFTG